MSDIIGFRMAKTPKTEFVASLERGLRVLQTFSREHAQLTLSEVAVLTELSPATARRSLHTLEMLVYIAHASLNRAIRLTAGAGSRYPVYPTSMGRVLLAFQPETTIDAYFKRAV